MEACKAKLVKINGDMGLAAATVQCADCPLDGVRVQGTNSEADSVVGRIFQGLYYRNRANAVGQRVCDGGKLIPEVWKTGTAQQAFGDWPVE